MQRRFWNHLAVAVVATVVALGLAACGTIGTNDEDVIREGIASELDLLKDPTEENLSKYMGDVDTDDMDSLDEYGIDMYEMLGHLLAKFDYEIGDIQIDGTTAVADVTVSNVDVSAAIQTAVSSMTDEDKNQTLVELYNSGDEKAYMQQIFAYMYESIDASDQIVTTQTKLGLTKDGTTWTIDQAGLEELISAVYGGLDMGNLEGEA